MIGSLSKNQKQSEGTLSNQKKTILKKPHKAKNFVGLIREFYNQLDHNTKYVDVCRVRE